MWSPERMTGEEALFGLLLPNLLKILYQNRVLGCGGLLLGRILEAEGASPASKSKGITF